MIRYEFDPLMTHLAFNRFFDLIFSTCPTDDCFNCPRSKGCDFYFDVRDALVRGKYI